MSYLPGFPSAATYREMGLYPFPLSDPQQGNPDTGKKPRFDSWQALAINASDGQREAWDRNNWNLGLSLGPSSLVVLDSDTAEADAWAMANLPQTPWITRTAKGHHRFYRLQAGDTAPTNRVRILACGLDRKANGGYVVAPGSIHYTGVTYTALGDWAVPIQDLPLYDAGWFLEPRQTNQPARQPAQQGDSAVQRARAYLHRVPPAIQGSGGDDHTYQVACIVVRDFGLSHGDALAVLGEWNNTCSPPWEMADLDAKIRSALRNGKGEIGSKLATSSNRRGLRWLS